MVSRWMDAQMDRWITNHCASSCLSFISPLSDFQANLPKSPGWLTNDPNTFRGCTLPAKHSSHSSAWNLALPTFPVLLSLSLTVLQPKDTRCSLRPTEWPSGLQHWRHLRVCQNSQALSQTHWIHILTRSQESHIQQSFRITAPGSRL